MLRFRAQSHSASLPYSITEYVGFCLRATDVGRQAALRSTLSQADRGTRAKQNMLVRGGGASRFGHAHVVLPRA